MTAALVVWTLAFVLGFVLLGAVAGSSGQRRPRFWLRAAALSGVPAVLPLALAGGESVGVLPQGATDAIGPMLAFACVLTLIVTPPLLYRRPGASPGDSDGGGGGGPHRPPNPPDPPAGGIPLPDADQSGERLRDHASARRAWRRRRRAAREPRRTPTPSR